MIKQFLSPVGLAALFFVLFLVYHETSPDEKVQNSSESLSIANTPDSLFTPGPGK